MITSKYKDSMIYQRHSIRKFHEGKPVEPEQLEHILHAAMAAPSARNAQPWEFVVVTDPAKLNAIADVLTYGQMLRTASLAIIPCVRRAVVEQDCFYAQDMGASLENLLLAVHECGLGATWCGVHPTPEREQEIGEMFGIPSDVAFPFCVVAVGVPAETKEASDRYEEQRVHRGKW